MPGSIDRRTPQPMEPVKSPIPLEKTQMLVEVTTKSDKPGEFYYEATLMWGDRVKTLTSPLFTHHMSVVPAWKKLQEYIRDELAWSVMHPENRPEFEVKNSLLKLKE